MLLDRAEVPRHAARSVLGRAPGPVLMRAVYCSAESVDTLERGESSREEMGRVVGGWKLCLHG